jgi:hypothetical protein
VTSGSLLIRMLKQYCTLDKLKNNIYSCHCRLKIAAPGALGLVILAVAIVAAVMLKRKLSVAKTTAVTRGTV